MSISVRISAKREAGVLGTTKPAGPNAGALLGVGRASTPSAASAAGGRPWDRDREPFLREVRHELAEAATPPQPEEVLDPARARPVKKSSAVVLRVHADSSRGLAARARSPPLPALDDEQAHPAVALGGGPVLSPAVMTRSALMPLVMKGPFAPFTT